MAYNEKDTGFGWDVAELSGTADRPDIPDGHYMFEVVSFERGVQEATEWCERCPVAKIGLAVNYHGDDSVVVTAYNRLTKRNMKTLADFFRCIDGIEGTAPVKADWDGMMRKRGIALFKRGKEKDGKPGYFGAVQYLYPGCHGWDEAQEEAMRNAAEEVKPSWSM